MAKAEKIICSCRKITVGQIQQAVAAGAHKYGEVKAATGAGGKCKKCKKAVKKVIKKYL
ncbi:MAG: (2Fe-2S)-binding protein [Acidaminococcaceae bacterium]